MGKQAMKKSFAMVSMTMILAAGAPAMAQEDAGLTPAQVKRWMQTRIELAHMQREMQANPAAYDDLPRAYLRKSNAHLETSGYGAARFKAHQTRINNAESVLRNLDDMAADRQSREAETSEACAENAADRLSNELTDGSGLRKVIAQMQALGLPQAEIDRVKANFAAMPNPDEQAAENCRNLRAGDAVIDQANQQAINMTRRDWDGVRPWLDELAQLTSWYARNSDAPHPPVLD